VAPSTRWGWHQLESGWAERLVAAAAIAPGSLVVDVGAGTGAITAPLLDAGARVIAVEAHPQRAHELRCRFGRRIVVVQADASDLRLPRKPFHVVANPPFAVSTALLRRLLQPGGRLLSARLILQDQAARRWASLAAPGAGRWSRQFEVTIGLRVPRRAFLPPPHVDARVLVIERRALHRG
jgi:23S rRNA (adenine-N6)-dimethyltransferase